MKRRLTRIAIDTGVLTSGHAVRGIGVHTRELIQAIKQLGNKLPRKLEKFVHFPHSSVESDSTFSGSLNKAIKVDAFDFSSNQSSLLTRYYDIIHYPYFHPYFVTLPFQKPAPKVVVTIHDLIPLIYPKHYPPGIRASLRFLIQKYLLKKVDAIITISETSKKDICRFLGVHPNKVHIVHLAPRRIFRKLNPSSSSLPRVVEKYGLPEKFVLYVGDVNYNKNLPALAKASKDLNIPLVICGKQALDIDENGTGLDVLKGPRDWLRFIFDLPHPELEHFRGILKEFKGNKNIKRLGFVPDEDLLAIYNLASLYCQPSFYEGFGLPILEAASCGVPVVASRIQAHVEIAEKFALFVDPQNPNDIRTRIREILENEKLRNSLVNIGLKECKKYSWEKTARQTAEVCRAVVAKQSF